ncbi:MAG: ISL3 family transposase, partial [Acidobacteria bacterium]|nr:ISL3 family transposase [Acidobacteriota bacterium]
MNANTLLADPTSIEIEKFVSHDDEITIVVRSIQPMAHCPRCHQPSCSLKTRYLRRIADLPWHGIAVGLQLLTRKFRCRNELCQQKVFCERLPTVVAPFARRTVRLSKVIELLAFALGARPGVRATAKLAFPIGKDTCLRIMRRSTPARADSTVAALGVDDFAFRKGCTYGTILVDLEQHQPIDLLPDRTADTLAHWLKAHSEIEIFSRDRSPAYADAARRGAPHAAQVADRWHLLKNLGELVERYFVRHHQLLTKAAIAVRAEHVAEQSEVELPVGAKATNLSYPEKPVTARRQQLFDAIKELQSQDKSLRRIARELKVARNTVRRYISCETAPPHAAGAGRPSSVLPFAGYLQQRWRAGEHIAFRLWQEITAQGFAGEVDAVQRFVRGWRKTRVGQVACPVTTRGLSPRRAAKLLLRRDAAGKEWEQTYLSKLCQISPPVKVLQQLGHDFQSMVKERRADLFDDWLKRVAASRIEDLQNWAQGLLADEAAVRNALSSVWSNGQVEGQVNRLKMIKRQMYGRA